MAWLNNPFETQVVPIGCADAIFSHLGMLFGIGVAVGFAKENHGCRGPRRARLPAWSRLPAAALIHAPADVTAGLSDKLAKLAAADYSNGAVAHFGVPCGILGPGACSTTDGRHQAS